MLDFAAKILASKLGHTHIFSVGQAGYIIKSSSGQLLAIDLYLSNCVERLEGSSGFKRLLPQILSASDIDFDVVICTHAHFDHFDVDSVPELIINGHTKLFCSYGCEKLVNDNYMHYNKEQIIYVKPFDKFQIGDFNINFVNCDHGTNAPDAVGVVITVDGKRIYEAGDTCLRLDRLNEISRPVDVLIAPINGFFGNLDEKDCAALAEHLQPRLTIPCHYGMFASHHGDIGKFYDIMTGKNLNFLIMRQGEKYSFE